MANSNSTGLQANFGHWIGDNYELLKKRVRAGSKGADAPLRDADRYAQMYAHYTGKSLNDARILEIGYGARPLRLITMCSMGYNATGIDLDAPMLEFGLAEIARIFRQNGARRALKSTVRAMLFDKSERRALTQELKKRGHALNIPRERFLVGDASKHTFDGSSFDFIYSEDVFEHIPADDLKQLVSHIKTYLSPKGVGFFAPHVFSGISGSHLPEWYPAVVDEPGKKTAPWEHLRQKRVIADCYLNELRMSDYSAVLSEHFDIIDIKHRDYGLGERHLTPEILEELSDYTRDDLLTNRVTFVIRHKSAN